VGTLRFATLRSGEMMIEARNYYATSQMQQDEEIENAEKAAYLDSLYFSYG